jgi:hypothetical protein
MVRASGSEVVQKQMEYILCKFIHVHVLLIFSCNKNLVPVRVWKGFGDICREATVGQSMGGY